MIVPNVRDKYVKSLFQQLGHSDQQENPYYEGNLVGEDKVFADGYDYALGEIKSFFYNVDVFEETFKLAFNKALLNIDCNVIDSGKTLDDYSDDELRLMSDETRVMLAMKLAISDWLESSRNNLIVSMLDTTVE